MADLTFLVVRPTAETSAVLRTKEAALYLAMSQKQLRRLVRLREIPVIQRGNVWLFRVDDLDAYLAGERSTTYPVPSGTKGFEVRKNEVEHVN